jgi:hypothetical protein
MKIDEVVELPTGAVSFKAELSPEQTTAMVRWFITTMLRNGVFKVTQETENQDTSIRH